jgi:hypothetical protein
MRGPGGTQETYDESASIDRTHCQFWPWSQPCGTFCTCTLLKPLGPNARQFGPEVGNGSGVLVTAGVADGVAGVGVSVTVAVGVALGVGVSVGVAVAVPVGGSGVFVGVAVGVGVLVGVGVGVVVDVDVGVAVRVNVGVRVDVKVGVGVIVGVWVLVAVGVTVGVTVGVEVGVNVAHIPGPPRQLAPKTGKQPGPHCPPTRSPRAQEGSPH